MDWTTLDSAVRARGLTEVAAACGMSKAQLSTTLQRRTATVSTLERICGAVGLSLSVAKSNRCPVCGSGETASIRGQAGGGVVQLSVECACGHVYIIERGAL